MDSDNEEENVDDTEEIKDEVNDEDLLEEVAEDLEEDKEIEETLEETLEDEFEEVGELGIAGETAEPTKTKKSRHKNQKIKQLPFIAKKHIVGTSRDRLVPVWKTTNLRDITKQWLEKTGKNTNNLEKFIFNAVVRKVKTIETKVSLSSTLFKTTYLEAVRWFASRQSNIEEAIKELKEYKFGWESNIWDKQRQVELCELKKIEMPTILQEYLDHPCPRCKGIKHSRIKKQLRGGDEGESAIFTCGGKGCGHIWKVNG